MDIFTRFQTLWVVVACAGFACSGYFYYRAFSKILGRQAGKTPAKTPRPPVIPAPPSADEDEAEIGAEQSSLLDSFDDAIDPTGDRSVTEAIGEEPVAKTSGYGVDQVRTTKRKEHKDPSKAATQLMSRSADGLDDQIQDAVAASMAASQAPAESDASDTAQTDSAAGDVVVEADDTPVETDKAAERRRRRSSQTDIIRKAQKHEDMGLHYGIEPQQLEAEQRLATAKLDDILARLDDALSGKEASDAAAPSQDSAASKQASDSTAASTTDPSRGDSGYQQQADRATAKDLRSPEDTDHTPIQAVRIPQPSIIGGRTDKDLTAGDEAPAEELPTGETDPEGDAGYQRIASRRTAKGLRPYRGDSDATADEATAEDEDETDQDDAGSAAASAIDSMFADETDDSPATDTASAPDAAAEAASAIDGMFGDEADDNTATDAAPDAGAEAAQAIDGLFGGAGDEETADPDEAAASDEAASVLDGMPDDDITTGSTAEPAEPTASAPKKAPTDASGSSSVPSWARADTFDDDVDGQDQGPKQHSLFD